MWYQIFIFTAGAKNLTLLFCRLFLYLSLESIIYSYFFGNYILRNTLRLLCGKFILFNFLVFSAKK